MINNTIAILKTIYKCNYAIKKKATKKHKLNIYNQNYNNPTFIHKKEYDYQQFKDKDVYL